MVRNKVVCTLEGYYLTTDLKKFNAKVQPFDDYDKFKDLELMKKWKCDFVMLDGSDFYILKDMYYRVYHEMTSVINPYGIAVPYFRTELAHEVSDTLRKLFTKGSGVPKIQRLENATLLAMETDPLP